MSVDLLKSMIRIRRFEDKCAELYTQEKIRGFLHLYDGEEAVAAGVIPRPDAKRPGRRDLSRTRPRAGARRADDRGHGRDVRQGRRLRRRARRVDASLFSRTRISMAAMPSSAAGCRSPSASRSPTRCEATTPSPPVSSAKARWPRASSTRHESRLAVGSAGAVRLREQRLRHGHRVDTLRGRDRHQRQGEAATTL